MFPIPYSLVPFFLGILIPGWGHLFKGNAAAFFAFQLSIISGVLCLCWSGIIFLPFGGILLLGYIGFIHALSAILSVTTKPSFSLNHRMLQTIRLIVFPLLFLSLVSNIYTSREALLGFGIYVIPSDSMEPTLKLGDVVIVDTWAYKNNNTQH